jgi:predicted alpha/beta superfamily hydrolase
MHRIFIALVLAIVPIAPLSTQSPTDTALRASPLVIGETFTINSDVLHEVRRINVYTPAVYMDSPSVRLPVLYMPDGGMAEDFLHVAGLVQVSTGNYTMRPFILVGIENTERRRDMTGPTTVHRDSTIAKHVSGSAPFRKFIRTELMPRIKSRYRTTNETAVVGESLAGLFIVETFLREPDLFDTYIALDPSLWWNNHELVDKAGAMLRARAPNRKRIFLANSDEPELADLTKKFADILKAGAVPGLEWYYMPFPDEGHGTIYHPAALRAFRLLFKPAPTK